jgi:MFS superfamily sulfate permease-like transporter
VGALLVVTAWRLVREPPSVFRATPSPAWLLVLAAAAFAGVVWAAHRRRYGVSLGLVAAGVVATLVATGPPGGALSFHLPSFDLPGWNAMSTAFLLLVVPQLPLTFGNAVVATSDLATEYFGPAAARVTPSRVCLSAGAGNVVSALGGGMPMCHGAGGLTAHYRLGARTARMNMVLGLVLVGIGLLFAPQIPAILGTLPAWVLAAFLAYAGFRHALLVSDLRGFALGLAVVAGGLGAWTGNLAITAGLAVAVDQGCRAFRRTRRPAGRGAQS